MMSWRVLSWHMLHLRHMHPSTWMPCLDEHYLLMEGP